MITQEFLSQCCDEQINRGVSWCVVSNANISTKLASEKYSFAASFLRSRCNKTLINYKRYCTNPNDIMPIAFANAISLETHDGSSWWVDAPIIKDDSLEKTITSRELKNPLRAICEVYILMSVNK